MTLNSVFFTIVVSSICRFQNVFDIIPVFLYNDCFEKLDVAYC